MLVVNLGEHDSKDLVKMHPDNAALRRHMIKYGILERDGESVYWVK
jgi:hypothetical protein